MGLQYHFFMGLISGFFFVGPFILSVSPPGKMRKILPPSNPEETIYLEGLASPRMGIFEKPRWQWHVERFGDPKLNCDWDNFGLRNWKKNNNDLLGGFVNTVTTLQNQGVKMGHLPLLIQTSLKPLANKDSKVEKNHPSPADSQTHPTQEPQIPLPMLS